MGKAALRRTIARLGVLQLDSVNVFERSHYIPLLSRLGPYDRALLDGLLHHDRTGRPRLGEFTEYTAHEATILPVADWGLWAWHHELPGWKGLARWGRQNRGLVDDIRAEFAERGPMRAGDLEHPANATSGGGWWTRNDANWATRYLFQHGGLVVVGRQRFQQVLAVPEQVLPPEARGGLPKDEAVRELVRRAGRVYGVATLDDLSDYWRLPVADVRVAVAELEATGELEPAEVEGWGRPAWLAAGTRVPRRVEAAALLSPFDPLVWYRLRAERLFGFHYRIGIYTPAAQRTHGYYVLPVLVDDRLVGRVDLKSDRRRGVLLVQHAHIEPDSAHAVDALARRVAPLLHEAAAWQGLGDVVVAGAGTWAAALARML